MQTESIVLLIDPSEEDRADIRSILESRPVTFIEADTASEAWEKVRSAGELTMMIAGISGSSQSQGERRNCCFSGDDDGSGIVFRLQSRGNLFRTALHVFLLCALLHKPAKKYGAGH